VLGKRRAGIDPIRGPGGWSTLLGIVLNIALADLTDTKQGIQLNLNFREISNQFLVYIGLYYAIFGINITVGYTYADIIFFVHLKFKFNWGSYFLLCNPK
jgi:hypothetical protein